MDIKFTVTHYVLKTHKCTEFVFAVLSLITKTETLYFFVFVVEPKNKYIYKIQAN